jgi:hypothetical protein
MTKLHYLFFVFAGAVCASQSVLNTPVNVGPSAPAFQQEQSPDVAPGFIDAPIPSGGNRPSGIAASLTAVGPGEAPAAEANPARVVGPLVERSEFEQFAEDAAGRPLPVYGRELFGEVPTTFAPLEHVPVPADYVLGPGDELLIRAWGKIDLDSRVTVDRIGQIDLPRVGMLTVAGLRYEQVEGYLHAAVGALFKDFELNVVLGQLRSIQIFVLGNARRPGAYTVSSLSTRSMRSLPPAVRRHPEPCATFNCGAMAAS